MSSSSDISWREQNTFDDYISTRSTRLAIF